MRCHDVTESDIGIQNRSHELPRTFRFFSGHQYNPFTCKTLNSIFPPTVSYCGLTLFELNNKQLVDILF